MSILAFGVVPQLVHNRVVADPSDQPTPPRPRAALAPQDPEYRTPPGAFMVPDSRSGAERLTHRPSLLNLIMQ